MLGERGGGGSSKAHRVQKYVMLCQVIRATGHKIIENEFMRYFKTKRLPERRLRIETRGKNKRHFDLAEVILKV